MLFKTMFFILIDSIVGFVLAKTLFKTSKNFLKAIKYIIIPDFVSALKKDWDNDNNYSLRLGIWVVAVVSLVVLEILYFITKKSLHNPVFTLALIKVPQ